MTKSIKPSRPVFILGGRYGDIIQLLPAFREVYNRTGIKPIVITSTDYVSVYEGVSYVQPHPMDISWWELPIPARAIADQIYGNGTIIQWWRDPKADIPIGSTILQSHGQEWGVDMSVWPDYGTSMWARAGFTPQEMKSLPLVFDRRDRPREAALSAPYSNRKPMLLMNFKGFSSPFPAAAEVMGEIIKFRNQLNIVDLGNIHAHRIFDLLGLYDRAIGMITTDTASLHLAPASNIPYLAFTVDGWSSSVPKGNCRCEIKYGQAINRIKDVPKFINQLITDHAAALLSRIQNRPSNSPANSQRSTDVVRPEMEGQTDSRRGIAAPVC